MKRISLVVTFVLGMAALAIPAAAQDARSDLAGTFWQLVALNGQPIADGIVANALFDGKRVGGSAGCNSYSASYAVDGSSITFGRAASTLMMCANAPMQAETVFLQALPLAASFEIAGARLTIFDANGSAILVFVKPAAALEDAIWTLQTLNGQPVLPDTTITLSASEGRLSGSAGCNQYTAPFALDGSRLSLGPAVSTRMACGEAIMRQETAFFAALEQAMSLQIGVRTVTLLDANGEPVLVFARPDALDGTTWRLAALKGELLPDEIMVTLAFKDGDIGGSGGCNSYGGEYLLESSALTIPPTIVSTMMACEEPRMSVEQAYFAALTAVTGYAVGHDQLVLSDAAGAELLRFVPME